MPISIQNLSGYPQPFLYSPQHLKDLLEVDEGIWAVCIGHVDNLSLPQKLLSHLDQDCDQLILAKDIKHSIRWCLNRIENPDWFFLRDIHEENHNIPVSYLSSHLQSTARHFLQSPTEESLLFTELQENLVKLQSMYNDGLLFLRDIDPQFHDDFLVLCQVLGKTDGLSQGEIKTALSNLQTFTRWETELVPETYLKPSMAVIDDWNNMKEDILSFFDAHLRGQSKNIKEELFVHTTEACIKDKDHWVLPSKQKNWVSFCSSILDIYHQQHNHTTYFNVEIWNAINTEIEKIIHYIDRKPHIDWSSIPIAKRNELENKDDFQKHLHSLFEKERQIHNDLQLADELYLLFLYQRHLLPLIRVFANFVDFYNPTKTSLIETGSVLIDGQYLHLVIQVHDIVQHKKRAGYSSLFLIYVEVLSNQKKMVCSITQGRKKDWYIGKNGVFIDRDGLHHPIRICEIIENPISITEELLIPLFTFVEFLKTRFENWSSKRKIELETQMDSLIESTAKENETQKVQTNSSDGSWFMHGGLAFAALGSSFAYILQTLTSIPLLTLLTLLIAPLLLWMLISGIRGGIKIHNRDLGPLLEGNGWSLHHALHIPIWANDIFTKKPKLPKTHHYLTQDKLVDFYTKIDPFFAIKYRLLFLLLVVLFILFYKNRDDMLAILDLIH